MNTFKTTVNLTADPELKFANGSGKAYVRLRVAESRGEGKDSNFFDVKVFDKQAENIADSLHKGDRVVIDGYFDSARTYEAANGETRIALDVIANDVYPSLRFATVSVTRNEKSEASAPAPTQAQQYDYPEEEF